jgi:hypothetical protein
MHSRSGFHPFMSLILVLLVTALSCAPLFSRQDSTPTQPQPTLTLTGSALPTALSLPQPTAIKETYPDPHPCAHL